MNALDLSRVLVVAEGGSNHGGSLDAAIALTDAAADAGAGAMKWQLWLSADEIYPRETTEWADADRWRLPAEWLPTLSSRARERGMLFGLSSFGFASLDEADKWVDFHKVASIEHTWAPFVMQVLAKNKPTLISLGASHGGLDLEDENVDWAELAVPLHCVVSYPADLSECHLRSHPTGTMWGLSDHSTHPTIAPCAAVALGASVVEKHLRLHEFAYLGTTDPIDEAERGLPPDWAHSIDPGQFRQMVEAIRLTEKALGSSEKRVRPSEEKYLRYRRGPKGLRGA